MNCTSNPPRYLMDQDPDEMRSKGMEFREGGTALLKAWLRGGAPPGLSSARVQSSYYSCERQGCPEVCMRP